MIGIFFIHILKSSVCLAMLYLCYRLLLCKETFHRFNRIALLSLPVLSLVIPFIELTMSGASDMPLFFISLEEIILNAAMNPEDVLIETPKHLPWNTLILSVYAGGILFLLVRQVWSLGRMWYLLRTSRKEKMDKNITLYIHRKKVAPFSWMKLIAISEEDLEKNGKAILAHERAHILNRHSWDMLLAQVCVFLQWFNPAAWLWMDDLKTIHEYETDEWVIRHDMDARSYQLSLIERVVGTRRFTMANSFNQSLLNKRITMMNKARSRRWARLKYSFVLPVVTLSVVAFAHPEDKAKHGAINATTEKTAYTTPIKEKIIFMIAEEMPEFPGGMDECKKFISKNTKYPAEAQLNGIQGRVEVNFLVTDEGDIKAPTISNSVDPLLDAEALRVIQSMPKWKPGKQRGKPVNVVMKLPISFKIQ